MGLMNILRGVGDQLDFIPGFDPVKDKQGLLSQILTQVTGGPRASAGANLPGAGGGQMMSTPHSQPKALPAPSMPGVPSLPGIMGTPLPGGAAMMPAQGALTGPPKFKSSVSPLEEFFLPKSFTDDRKFNDTARYEREVAKYEATQKAQAEAQARQALTSQGIQYGLSGKDLLAFVTNPEEFSKRLAERQGVLSADQSYQDGGRFIQAPGADFTLGANEQRFTDTGNVVASGPQKPVEALSTIGKLRADLDAGRITQAEFDGEVSRIQRGEPSLSVQFGEGGALAGITYGSAQKGQEAAIIRGADGQPLVSPGPQQEQYRKANNFLKSKQRQIGIVRDDIRRASELVKDPMATGPLGAIGRELPIVGAITPGGRLASRIKTIKTNIGFDKIDEMRQNSPTGGALGNVTEKEIDFLQAVAGELDNAQSDEDVNYVLRRIDAFYADLEQQYAEAFALDYPSLAETAEFRTRTNQQAADLQGLFAPDGDPVTEDDIAETMRKHNVTREQVIARLRGQ